MYFHLKKMNDFSSNVSISILNQNLMKRRVNFYIAKPKESSLNEIKTESIQEQLKPQLLSLLALENEETSNCTDEKMINHDRAAENVYNERVQKRKYNEIDFDNQIGGREIAQFQADFEESYLNKLNSFTQYHVKLDKNVDSKVNALITEVDSKGSILVRNSFLYEEPIAWQRSPPFSKKPPKRSLSILSANYLQFDDAYKNDQLNKNLLNFPDLNIALLASIDYRIDMKMMSDLVFSGDSECYVAHETDSECDLEFYRKKS